ncbi:MAG: TetR/AcrR family transcriptional regulator [Pseudomonadota bacterium]
MKRARTDSAKDARKQRLMAAALDEFYERGFAAARMEDIAQRVKLSKGTLYLYFSSKDDLFRALIDTYAVPNLEQIEQIMSNAPAFSMALDAIAVFAPEMITKTHLPKLLKVLAGDSHNFPDVVQSYRSEVIDRGLAAIAGLLARADSDGEIQVDDPALVARLVIAPMVLSLLWQAVFDRTKGPAVDLARLFQLHAQYMKRALGVEDA